ncbi:hypothetical protein M378DRAFT_161975 [Amanita muscaria Koide BX008]|uniref:Uncharacterized protein n=1 Tax=Amanita muscaria (strain Koide BX008) TaxID=946122 RepID=A0A0C2X8N4_AMAMK|nr:hypothetical protein M378DRAFT_165991 [Amanita muscaria Koide BX008]KIL65666.1 hypothetical protein M378DRAFT_161975 [Amanita muscaria Koide BX008]
MSTDHYSYYAYTAIAEVSPLWLFHGPQLPIDGKVCLCSSEISYNKALDLVNELDVLCDPW